MSKLFGTDSARGITVAELSCELAMQAGKAAAELLAKEQGEKIIVAKDKTLSSDVLEAAVCAGICSSGIDAETIGAVPAAAASYIVKEHKAATGIMITEAAGSEDSSGIRIFGRSGLRLSEAAQQEIENYVFASHEEAEKRFDGIGKMLNCSSAVDEYMEHIKSAVKTDLGGLKIVVDCGRSSAGITAERLFSELGAEVVMLPENPVGEESDFAPDITNLERLMEFVADGDCCCGLAIDGDGGSCLAVDENGMLVDGDSLLAIFSKFYKEQGWLKENTAVISIMSSLGLVNFAKENGINVVTSGGWGRSVIDRMIEGGYNLGGGQSGHIFFTDDSACDDGQLCGARLLEIMKITGKKLSELAGEMKRLPQISLNVRISDSSREVWKNDSEITGLIESFETDLGSEGRIIVREGGENGSFIRVMIEGNDFGRINSMAMEIARKIRERCALREG
ncbi:MAG: phosphoglucosamine mutase [Ruminococcus flavefaciens]|nr:phosphoglucosamine mutase [Ruminococcus flavefaciens]MCM1060751.1 phosphoglucosamine mutase [Eubacterium sp.]